MEVQTKRLKNGFEMPVYGFGTWGMGGREARDPKNDDVADIAAIRAAIDAGVTHIDTAELYAAGHAERLVASAIKGIDRKRLFIASKVSWTHLGYDDIMKSAKASLGRIGTDYLDLYYIHGPDPRIPIRESMRAMNELRDQGLIRNIAVSNFGVSRFEDAQSHSSAKIVANQLHYNLRVREVERKRVLDYCQQNDVMLVAWRPVEKGGLTGKGTALLDEMAAKYGKTQSQVAINWLVSQGNVVTLSKTRSTEHLRENLGAVGWTMEPQDVERLRAGFPNQSEVSRVPLID